MASIQEQYNLITEGKFAKDVFLKNVKQLFPDLIPNHYGFDLTAKILKQKSIITEGYIDLEATNFTAARPKEDWENKFEKFLAEEKKAKESTQKAESTKLDKYVTDTQSHGESDKDTKNIDDVIFGQLQLGVYTEMSKDPDQDLKKVKDIVLKNLTKDPIYYTKNAPFGIEMKGYTDDNVALKLSKSDKMEPVSKEKIKSNVKDTLSDKESVSKGSKSKLIKKEMSFTPQNSKGVKKMDLPGKEKIIKLKEGMGLADLLGEDDIDEGRKKPLYTEDIFNHPEAKHIITDEDQKTLINYFNEEQDEDISDLDTKGKTSLEAAKLIGPEGFEEETLQHIINVLNPGKYNPIYESLNEENKQFTEDILFNFKKDWEEAGRDENDPQYAQETVVNNYKSKYSKYPAIVSGIEEFCSQYVTESFQSIQKRFKESLDAPKKSFATRLKETIKKVLEGPLEDADAQLAKQAADEEAKIATIKKQRADNAAKIAAADKNV